MTEPPRKAQTMSKNEARLHCEGKWYCRPHLPDNGYKKNCTHALGFGLGSCCFCGETSS